MTDPLSERLEKAYEEAAGAIPADVILTPATISELMAIMRSIISPILRDEIAAAEEAGFNEAQERASNNLPGIIAQYMGNGALARHDAAMRERTLGVRMTKFLWYLSLVILGSVLLGYEVGVIEGKHVADRWYAAHPVPISKKITMPIKLTCKNYSVTENQDGTYTIMWNQLGNE